MKIGFIGLGIMGLGMARNLQKEFPELHLYNRDKTKTEEFIEKGATTYDNPAELAREVDTLITMLTTPEVVKEIALGQNGFLPAMKEGSLWIDSTTVNPSFSKEMSAAAKEHKIRFLDAPVAGSKKPAASGELLFLAGGSAENVAEAEPLFSLMGRKTIHAGENGMGSSLKMVINLLLGQSLLVFSEAVNFGKAMGLPQEFLLNALLGGPVVSPFVATKKEKFESGDYEVEFPLEWAQKDLKLAALTAKEVGVVIPSGKLARDIYAKAIEMGMARDDFSAIFKYYNENEDK